MSDHVHESGTDSAGRFHGHANRRCGEHRTAGGRAWCFDCTEWCYPRPEAACEGCQSVSADDAREMLARVRELHQPKPYLSVGGTDMACPICGPVGNGYGPSYPCATVLAAGGVAVTGEDGQ